MNYETFIRFAEMTHEDIFNILVENLYKCRDAIDNNRQALLTDSRSTSLKNKSRELGAALSVIEELLDDLGIDADEIE